MVTRKLLSIIDFKLSPCFEYCMYSFGYFPGVRLWFADVAEASVSSIFKGWVWRTEYSTPSLWRWNWQKVPKRRQITICRRGNTQKNTYKILSITLYVHFLSHYTNICHLPLSDTLQLRVSLAWLCTAKITHRRWSRSVVKLWEYIDRGQSKYWLQNLARLIFINRSVVRSYTIEETDSVVKLWINKKLHVTVDGWQHPYFTSDTK
jgi:hypothetical protein